MKRFLDGFVGVVGVVGVESDANFRRRRQKETLEKRCDFWTQKLFSRTLLSPTKDLPCKKPASLVRHAAIFLFQIHVLSSWILLFLTNNLTVATMHTFTVLRTQLLLYFEISLCKGDFCYLVSWHAKLETLDSMYGTKMCRPTRHSILK